jgi:hypothetical protein
VPWAETTSKSRVGIVDACTNICDYEH